jgi:phospholipase C
LRGSFVDARGDCHYREEDIPRYFALARAFTLCDNYFGELLAPSVPNYFMLMAAESPLLENPQGRQRGRFTTPSIIDRLAARGIAWRNYDGGLPLVSLFAGAAASGNIVPEDTFFADARDGRLPAVSWLTPSIADSEHPAYSIRRGEEWTIRRINALMQSPLWPRLAAIVVWDEWGGFRDHVAPPVAERDAEYDVPLRYGYRVPCLVVGPYARRGYVSHTRYSHVSVLRTIERLFDLPPLTARDAAANDLLDCFDFAQPPQPPKLLPDET